MKSERAAYPQIRSSTRLAHSNPILYSERVYCSALPPRTAESRQLAALLRLQNEGGRLFRCPDFKRADASALCINHGRAGVFGLVVDNAGEGYVTQLKVESSAHWQIADNLPFRAGHIQEALLCLLGSYGTDSSLPELWTFRITDALGERCEGDSMDIACLLAIIDKLDGQSNQVVSRSAAVVCPAYDGALKPVKSVEAKLKAFTRELGRGSLLVRHPDDFNAAAYDQNFDLVWRVRTFGELADNLHRSGLLGKLLEPHSLTVADTIPIISQMQKLMSDESRLPKAIEFIARLKNRLSDATPLRLKLEIYRAEEDVCRHSGRFDRAIELRALRSDMESHSRLTCYEHQIDEDTRTAAALYDAHRFHEMVEILAPWFRKIDADPLICSPESRPPLLNTLARALVVTGDNRWEELLLASIELQKQVAPSQVARTANYLIHGYLKTDLLNEAGRLLERMRRESIDHESRKHLNFLDAEFARQAGRLWSEEHLMELQLDAVHHTTGFLLQAVARQRDRSRESRCELFQKATGTFMTNVRDDDRLNIKRLLAACCRVGFAIAGGSPKDLESACGELATYLDQPGLQAVKTHYSEELDRVLRRPCDETMDALFSRVPFF